MEVLEQNKSTNICHKEAHRSGLSGVARLPKCLAVAGVSSNFFRTISMSEALRLISCRGIVESPHEPPLSGEMSDIHSSNMSHTSAANGVGQDMTPG